VAGPKLASRELPQREVLRHVIARNDGMSQQGRDAEDHGRQQGEQQDRNHVAAGQPEPAHTRDS